MLRNFLLRFKNVCETSEGHPDGELRTHYYRANKDSLFEGLKNMLGNKSGYNVTEASKEHGEIACDLTAPFPCFLIATVVTVRPFETAVDFHLSTDRASFLANYPKMRNEILSLYRMLDQSHTYIGAGKNSQ